jgi:hypothetical protein
MMQNGDLVVLSTADLWALHKTVAALLVNRIAKRFRELDAQLARLPPESRPTSARRRRLPKADIGQDTVKPGYSQKDARRQL